MFNRTLNRPMFRRGGRANGGIMTGVQRPGYANDDNQVVEKSDMEKVSGNMESFNKAFNPPAPSDVRLKTDIENIGKSSLGVNIYSFKYKGDDKTYQGVMAQEVPWASSIAENGYLQVDYSKVDVEFKRLN